MGNRESIQSPICINTNVHNGFRDLRRHSVPSVSVSTATTDHALHLIWNTYNDAIYEIDNDNESQQLLSQARLNATKHGILKSDFHYIEQEHIVCKISNKFTFIKALGYGGSSRVLLVIETNTNTKYALKELVSDDEYNPQLFKKEIRLLSKIQHPNILKYHSSYIDASNFYISTHYYEGGTLLQRCQRYKTLSECVVYRIIYQILDAVQYLHKHNIVHRDLKPSNIVFNKPGFDGRLVIIDFGDSEVVGDDEMYNEFVGTIHYLPPEVMRYRHGRELKKGDIWSIGVLMYESLCGIYPFHGRNNREILSKIKYGKFSFPQRTMLSQSAKLLMRMLIRKNVRARLSASDAMKHRWFIEMEKMNVDNHLSDTLETAVNGKNPMKKL